MNNCEAVTYITIEKEKVMLALEALERVNNVDDDCDILSPELANFVVDTIDAVKEALASEQEQRSDSEHTGEPVAWYVERFPIQGTLRWGTPSPPSKFTHGDSIRYLYTTPQPVTESHKRKPLTGKQIALIGAKWHFNLLDKTGLQELYEYTRAIEAAHGIHPSDFKEKNT